LCLGGACAWRFDAGVQDGGTLVADAAVPRPDAGAGDARVPAGVIVVDPDTGLEFGATRLGVAVEKTVLVTNTGDGPFVVAQVGLRAASPGSDQGFTVETIGQLPPSLPAGGQFVLRVRFVPSSATPGHAFLAIVTTAQNAPLKEVELTASFKGTAALTVHRALTEVGGDVTELDLGALPLGERSVAHLYVKNTGPEGSVLTVDAVATDPAQSTAFSVRAGPLPRTLSFFPGTCVTPATCSPLATDCVGGMCVGSPDAGSVPVDVVVVEVTFQAVAAGAVSVPLRVTATVGVQAAERVVTLRGTGLVGSLSVTPSPLDLGEAFVGRSVVREVTVRNGSNVPGTVLGVSLSGLEPSLALAPEAPGTPAAVEVGASLAFPVLFSPVVAGEVADVLTVRVDGLEDIRVRVVGQGVLPPSIQVPATLPFGGVNAGNARSLDLVVHNAGPGPLRLGAMAISPTGPSPFSFNPTVVSTPVNPDDDVTLQVTFAPVQASATELTAELVLSSNDPNRPEARVRLTGNAVGPIAQLDRSPPVLDFGLVRVGTSPSPTQVVRLTNPGVGALQVSAVTPVLDASGNPIPELALTVSRALPTTVADQDADVVSFTLTYTPVSGELRVGTFTLSTSDVGRLSVPVTVSGRGLACSSHHIPVTTDENGVCNGVCEVGYADCNLNKLTNGCEVELSSTVQHCGACNLGCSPLNVVETVCTGGRCTGECVLGFRDCNNDRRSDGCEVEVVREPSHCGDCGQACSANNIATPRCTDGECTGVCNTGYADCNLDRRLDGCEVDTRANPSHCGACRQACSDNHVPAVTCDQGACTGDCAAGYGDCNNDRRGDGCETDTTVTAAHCGGCRQPCSMNHVPIPACANGQCTGECAPGWGDCNLDRRADGCETNTAATAAHCGGCGRPCSGQNVPLVTCTLGACTGDCAGGFRDCNDDRRTDGCEVDVQTNVTHCGECRQPCSANNIATPLCQAGACVGSCNTGFDDCNRDRRTDGCEVNTQTNPSHCGGCGRSCSANHVTGLGCSLGACTGGCEPGFQDCDNDRQVNGCETSTLTNPQHCGACNRPCSTNNIPLPTCSGGTCAGECLAGFDDCNGDKRTDGCETNKGTSPLHCGACNAGCSSNNIATPTCAVGQCTGACNTGFRDCNLDRRTDGCEVSIFTDPRHCGDCYVRCSTNNVVAAACVSGVCSSACSPGFLDCDNDKQLNGCEVNWLQDPGNCGGCRLACSTLHVPNRTCTAGSCSGACEDGFTDCDGDKLTNGCETDTMSSVTDCGECDLQCSTNHMQTTTCSSGACTGLCAAGYDDCNNDKADDGCETSVLSDPDNCGDCHLDCSGNNISTPTCSAGICDGTCNTGYADCNHDKLVDGCEVNKTLDPDNCGGCEVVCSSNHVATRTCTNSVCNGQCDPGWADCNNNKRTDGCEVDAANNVDNCGGCALACSGNHITTRVCSFGACTGTCDPGYLDCNGDKRTDGCEVNRLTDDSHCGNCTTVCDTSQVCSSGVCVPRCGIKINEVQTGSGSTEFVELVNTCETSANLRSHVIRYAASNGNPGPNWYAFPTGSDVTLAAGSFYVVGTSSFTGPKDVTVAASGLSDTAAGIGLYDAGGDYVDGVAWGAVVANHPYKEASAAPAPTAGYTIYRHPNGGDTNDNGADFLKSSAGTPPTPRAANP
jgi:hypothetical protein